MTLTEFLLARIAEDEAVSRTWHSEECDSYRPDFDGNAFPCDCKVSARVLAECEAKRRIVVVCAQYEYEVTNAYGYDDVLKALALPYADHPDFREEWGP